MGALLSTKKAVTSSKYGMSSAEFRECGRQLLDYIVDYSDNIRDRQPLPSVKPGFLKELVPAEAPEDPEPWHRVYEDIDRVIMKGAVHVRNPHFHGYVPFSASKVSTLATLLESTLSNLCTKWTMSPIATELEMLVMDWMAKALGLPDHFLHGGEGGGVIQTSSSESVLLTMCAARNKKIKQILSEQDYATDRKYELLPKLVVYLSDETHFVSERACLLTMIRFHKVDVTSSNTLCPVALKKAMESDTNKGLIPFFVIATLGTTSTCAFDNLKDIGPVCSSNGVWLHVDAAYAGAAFICPEFRHHLHGIEYVDSISVNFYKWMLVDLGCSGLWLKEHSHLSEEFSVVPYFMKDETMMPTFMTWGIQVSKKFSALKLWFVLRLYGIKGLQNHIRQHVSQAELLGSLIKGDQYLCLVHSVSMGVVCFKIKGQREEVNREYLRAIRKDGRVYVIASLDKNGIFIRLCIFDEHTTSDDIKKTYKALNEVARKVLKGNRM